MASWKQIFISNLPTLTNSLAIPGTVKLPFPIDKLFAYVEFAWNRITSVNDVINLRHTCLTEAMEKNLLQEEIQRVVSIPREKCLRIKENQEKTLRTPLVVTYNPLSPFFALITRHHLHIRHITECLWMAFPSPPLIAYCRPRNLKDLLGRAQLTPARGETPGNFLCGSVRCKTCPILLTTKVFTSHTTGEQFKVKVRASSNLILLFI